MYEITKDAIEFQRKLSEQEAETSYAAIEAEGGELIALSPEDRMAFVAAVEHQIADGRDVYGDEVFKLAGL